MTAPMTREELATRLREAAYFCTEFADLQKHCAQIADDIGVLPDYAQTAVTSGTLTFGALVENIAASDRNPIKRGIFIRKTSAKMAEYATKEGCHSTPLDNLRASNQGTSK